MPSPDGAGQCTHLHQGAPVDPAPSGTDVPADCVTTRVVPEDGR
jgi:hypothetical protein